MIVLFYVVVHEVQAFLIGKGKRPRDHRSRLAALAPWPDLNSAYRTLQSFASDARYQCMAPTKATLTLAELVLGQVRTEVARLEAPPPPQPS